MGESTGFLTTHILDTARGRPAAGVRIEIYRISGDKREALGEMVTNDDGRTDAPILPKGRLDAGTYELVFHMGAYFSDLPQVDDIPFVDIVPIRFGIANPQEHYHVPLLASPYGFSTYRGS